MVQFLLDKLIEKDMMVLYLEDFVKSERMKNGNKRINDVLIIKIDNI